MNIFVLDNDIEKCAQYHCDKHVVKMNIEYAQLLSTACRMNDIDAGYKITHKNHPCAIWVRASLSNWLWLKELCHYLNEEYKHRYNKTVNHKSYDVVKELPEPNIPDIGLTEFPQAMPEFCRHSDVVEAYRFYYMNEKRDIVSWKNREIPWWYPN